MAQHTDFSSIEQFESTLRAEMSAFHDFNELLQAEKIALASDEIDRLADLAQLKTEKVLQLSQLAEQRNLFLAAHSCLPDQPGMEEWCRRTRGQLGQRIHTLWQGMLDEARRAHRQNQENGVLIELKLEHNQQALNVIKTAANQQGVYGPDGKTLAAHPGRPIGKV